VDFHLVCPVGIECRIPAGGYKPSRISVNFVLELLRVGFGEGTVPPNCYLTVCTLGRGPLSSVKTVRQQLHARKITNYFKRFKYRLVFYVSRRCMVVG